jgi:DNA invertase Pin-like site-specific DNA recombinase
MGTLLLQIAFGYGRVSTTKQGLSREAQTETTWRAAAFHVAASRESAADFAPEMFFDDYTSRSIPFAERPSGLLLLTAVKAAIAAGGSPTIIVTKVDRLGRDTVDASQTVSLFESLGAASCSSIPTWTRGR